MSLVTIEVDLDHGRVTPKGTERLPEKATALLIVLDPKPERRDPLVPDPELRVTFYEDPASPLDPEDWPEAFA